MPKLDAPLLPGGKDSPQDEGFNMMDYMKKQRLAKEREMLEREEKDPNYKPLTPSAKMPPKMPEKDWHKLDEALKRRLPMDDKQKDKSLFDQINKEKALREQQYKALDPSYAPLTPNAKPKVPVKHPDGGDEKESSMYEQMAAARRLHEQQLMEEDARRAKEDPSYIPHFKHNKPDDDSKPKKYDDDLLKRRLTEERRKHRQDLEKQLEDALSEEDDFLESDEEEDSAYSADSLDDSEDSDDFYDSETSSLDDSGDLLDYYYDAHGFAHPKKSLDKLGLKDY